MLTVLLLFLISVLCILYNRRQTQTHQNYPPGPLGLPVIGNLHQLGKVPALTLYKWAKQYGNIYLLHYGLYKVVVLNHHDDLREALSLPEFSGRIDFVPEQKAKFGIVFNCGDSWRKNRRLLLRFLRDHGFGKATTLSLIQLEIQELLVKIKTIAENGELADPSTLFSTSILNTIWPLVTGNRVTDDDITAGSILHELGSALAKPRSEIVRFYPTIYRYWKKSSLFRLSQKKKETLQRFESYFGEIIRKHEETIDWNGESRDLIDEYLKLSNAEEDKSYTGEDGRKNLVMTLKDVYQASGDTTSRALNWICLLLTRHLDVQSKLQAEIDTAVGQETVTLLDRQRLPYTVAVIMESLRYSSFTPFSIGHSTTEDTVYRGYHIPKNTIIIPNLFAAMHDPSVWDNPGSFNPTRFLSQDEKTVKSVKAFLPFSIGRRKCIAISHSMDTLFLIVAQMFQKFELHPDPLGVELSLAHTGYQFLEPKPYKVKIVLRSKN